MRAPLVVCLLSLLTPTVAYAACAEGSFHLDLVTTIQDDATTPAPGATLTYVVTVAANYSYAYTEEALFEMAFSDKLAATWTVVGSETESSTGTAAACPTTPGSGNLIPTPIALPPGGTCTFTVTATVDPAARGDVDVSARVVENDYCVTEADLTNDAATNANVITPAADIGLVLSAPASVAVSEAYSYDIAVTNAGPNEATDLAVTLALPASVRFDGVTAADWGCRLATLLLVCERDELASGATSVIQVAVTAPETDASLSAAVSATASSRDAVIANDSATSSTVAVAPVLIDNDIDAAPEDSGCSATGHDTFAACAAACLFAIAARRLTSVMRRPER